MPTTARKSKGTRARRKASYSYQVGLHTNISKSNMPARPLGSQLDHIVPKEFGFKHNIPPELIGSKENLQWLPFNENIQKGTRITGEAIRVLRVWHLEDLADVYEGRI